MAEKDNSVYSDALKVAEKTRTIAHALYYNGPRDLITGERPGLTGAMDAARKTHGVAYDSYCRNKKKNIDRRGSSGVYRSAVRVAMKTHSVAYALYEGLSSHKRKRIRWPKTFRAWQGTFFVISVK